MFKCHSEHILPSRAQASLLDLLMPGEDHNVTRGFEASHRRDSIWLTFCWPSPGVLIRGAVAHPVSVMNPNKGMPIGARLYHASAVNYISRANIKVDVLGKPAQIDASAQKLYAAALVSKVNIIQRDVISIIFLADNNNTIRGRHHYIKRRVLVVLSMSHLFDQASIHIEPK